MEHARQYDTKRGAKYALSRARKRSGRKFVAAEIYRIRVTLERIRDADEDVERGP
jgi:hypothetical protein